MKHSLLQNVISTHSSLEDKSWHQPADIYNERVFLKKGKSVHPLEKIWLNRWSVIALAEAFREIIYNWWELVEKEEQWKDTKRSATEGREW